MLSLTIDLEGPQPVYQQIAAEIRRLIVDGSLLPGAELPSVRRLGEALGVNLNTVAKAYRQLSSEGIVELRPGAAARVLPVSAGRPQMDDSMRRALFDVFGRLALDGANREDLRAIVNETVDEFFSGSRGGK